MIVQIDKEKKAWIIFYYSLLYSVSTSPHVFSLSFTFRRKKFPSSFFLLSSLLWRSCCPSIVEAAQALEEHVFWEQTEGAAQEEKPCFTERLSVFGLSFTTGACRAALEWAVCTVPVLRGEETGEGVREPRDPGQGVVRPRDTLHRLLGKGAAGAPYPRPSGLPPRLAWRFRGVSTLAGAAPLGKGRGAGPRLRRASLVGGAGVPSLPVMWSLLPQTHI